MNKDYRVYTSTGEIDGQSYATIGIEEKPVPVDSSHVRELTRAVKGLKEEVNGIGSGLFLIVVIHFAAYLVFILNAIFK